MKKTKKRVLGLLGLILVVVTTIFAVFLPGPEASATNVTSVTDTITVRVVGSVPDVNITSPTSGSIFVVPNQNFSFSYENVENVLVTVAYTDKDNVTHNYILDNFNADYIAGDKTYDLDLLSELYGYGEYVIKVHGDGFGEDVSDEDSVAFAFYPVYGEATEDDNDGLIYLDLTYDTENENINTIGMNIYDANGNLVKVLSPITVKSPNARVELPFSENDLATGNYKIEITAYDAEGNALYNPYVTYVYYEAIPVPDTGTPFSNLNISKTDYLVTGLIIFLSAAVLGIIFVAKGRDKRAKVTRKRR